MNAWRKINELEGHEVECKNVADGKIVWKVVREVEDDKFISIRDPVHHTASEFCEKNFTWSFYALWPAHLDAKVEKLQNVIEN